MLQTATDAIYLTRHVALRSGIPIPVPALTVNRLCGSGFQSIVNGCQEIALRESEIVLCGGAESMSQAPYAVRNIRFGTKLGADITISYSRWKTPCGPASLILSSRPPWLSPLRIWQKNTALPERDCDKYSFQTQQRWKAAQDAGYFAAEMAPIELKSKKGPIKMDRDEHPRPQTTPGTDGKTAPRVLKKNGAVTAGNASGIAMELEPSL
ncbi:unnamed protein product [Ranitomeya imitator]|uniref:Thiolase N-terminal domain-containing protein n=1 Tax=Ranitomeya imitator TaxID=111125 RepID=A0ABN9M6D2_9NEOB|nr:unnamed protein product [Ranitomeya imitator]